MRTRRDMDVPAATLAIVAGVILVAVATPFAVMALDEGEAKEWLVTWSEGVGQASEQVTLAGTGAATPKQVTYAGFASNVTLDVVSCNDSADGTFSSPATMTYELVRIDGDNETVVKQGTFQCSDTASAEGRADNRTRPDVASVTGPSQVAADKKLERTLESKAETHTYELRLRADRPQATPLPPLPGASPTLGVAMSFTIQAWQPAIQESPEVVK